MKYIYLFVIFFESLSAFATLNVVTTTTTLQSFVKEIGGDKVNVLSLTKNTQDPHFIEAKPSYMVQLRKADLLVTVGLDLEIGWIGNAVRGARNPKILEGKEGYFESGQFIQAIETPKGKMDRSQGDVHPYGNPHFHLSPSQTINVIKQLALRLAKLDSDNETFYLSNGEKFIQKIKQNMILWKNRIDKAGVQSVITYHRTLNYFLNEFGIKSAGTIEIKPGIPPSAKQIIALIQLAKNKKVNCILNENYFETTAGQRIKSEVELHLIVVPVEVNTSYLDLIETLVESIEKCSGKKNDDSN